MSENELISDCKRALEKVGVPPADKLAAYMAQLLDWNTKINMTGARDPDEFALKHIADVWNGLRALSEEATEIVDVGSGGGIPGIVLGIMMPKSRITLVERRQKKANVLSSIVSHLELDKQIRVFAKTFEEIKPLPKDAEFWFRGFLPGPKLATYLSEAFPKGDLGRLVLMKGPLWPDEKLNIMSTPRVKDVWLERFGSAVEVPYELPLGSGERVLVLV